ncbi:MAG: porin family protein, partial [Burkholderiales bacterium]|nr:porin family protein [Burkholderiales bacterium]
TLFGPGGGFDDELRASLNLGFGYEQPLGNAFSLRFEARGYATLVDSSGGFFCSGGCIISISGDVITQGEVMLGVSARF